LVLSRGGRARLRNTAGPGGGAGGVGGCGGSVRLPARGEGMHFDSISAEEIDNLTMSSACGIRSNLPP